MLLLVNDEDPRSDNREETRASSKVNDHGTDTGAVDCGGVNKVLNLFFHSLL